MSKYICLDLGLVVVPKGENLGGREITLEVLILLTEMNFLMCLSNFTKSLNLFFKVTSYFNRKRGCSSLFMFKIEFFFCDNDIR